MRNVFILITLIMAFSPTESFAQSVSINNDGSAPNATALLDLKSTSQGLLVPRMQTTDRLAITSPATGLIVYDIDESSFWYFMGSAWFELVPGERMHTLQDADSDTKIIVEKTPDEDHIHFEVGGTEYLHLDSGRIEVLNTGSSIFIGDNAGLNDDYTDNFNVGIGYQSLQDNIGGHQNTAIGSYSLSNNVSGIYNAANGMYALYLNESGNRNVAIGTNVMADNLDGSDNTAVGYNALRKNNNRSEIVAIGRSTLYNNGEGATEDFEGTENTGIGTAALGCNRKGYYNTAVGYRALNGNNIGNRNTALGVRALYYSNNDNNTAVGYRSLYSSNSGYSNTAVGHGSSYSLTSGHSNAIFGFEADHDNQTGNKNTIIGFQAGRNSGSSDGCIFIGYQAGNTEFGDNKLIIENSNSGTPLIYGDFLSNIIGLHGKVGVGTKNPAYDIDIDVTNATIRLDNLEIQDKGSNNLGLDGDLVPFASTGYDVGNNAVGEFWNQMWAQSFNVYSDLETKRNVQALTIGLEEVLALRPVTFQYKSHIDPDDRQRIGLVAQEVQDVIPDVVISEDVDIDPETGEKIVTEGAYLGMNYQELIPVLIMSIQQLSAQNSQQQLMIDQLKKANKKVRAQVNQLQLATQRSH